MFFINYFASGIRPDLEVRGERRRSLAAFLQPRRAIAGGGPEAASFPSRIRIVDAAVEPLRVEAERVGNAQHDHLSVLERDQAVVFIAGRHRHVRAETGRVVLIDPAVIARLCAVVADAFEARARILVEGPALGALIAGCLWSVQRTLALAAVEAAQMAARERHPHDALRVDVAAADAEAGRRDVIDLGERGLRRILSQDDANDRAGVAAVRTPDRSVHRARHDRVEAGLDALVLRRIDGLIGLDVRVALAVAVRVEDERRPSLRLHDVAGRVVHLRVDPAEDIAAAAEPDGVVRIEPEFRMVRPEAGIERRVLAGLRIPHRRLPQRFLDRKQLSPRDGRSPAVQ